MRRRIHRGLQRGMTLLEIMIVLAILALVMGLVVGPRVLAIFADSKSDIARLAVTKYAHEAYPQWLAQHPGATCPASIDELGELMNRKSSKDPWGNQYKMFCAPSLPVGAKGIAIASPGPDHREGTDDDIRSW